MKELTDENIFLAMYVLNKSAKKSRDTQKRANNEGNLSVFKSAKKRKDFIYKIKHLAMNKLLSDGKISFIGIHKQEVNGKIFFLSYYKTQKGYSYHRPSTKSEINKYKNDEVPKMTVVPATVKYKQTIGFNESIELLLNYINMTKEDIKKLIPENFN